MIFLVRVLRHFPTFFHIFVFLVIVSLIQMILIIFVKPLNRGIFHKLNSFLLSATYIQPNLTLFNLPGSEYYLHTKPELLEKLQGKNLLILYNHVYDSDWLISFILLERLNILGNIKFIFKDSIKYLASVGLVLYLSGHIFLKRNFEKDAKILRKAMESFAKFPENNCILMAPEGKRYTSENFIESVKFAKQKKIEPFKYHMMPRVKGFKICAEVIKENPDRFTVINLEIGYEHKTEHAPTLMNLARGKAVTAHVYLDIVPMDKLEPTDECLFEIFRKKDKLQENFVKHGNFGKEKSIVKMKIPKSYFAYISGIFWVVLYSFLLFKICSLTGFVILAITISTISILFEIYVGKGVIINYEQLKDKMPLEK